MDRLPSPVLCLVTDIERAGGKTQLLRIVDEAVHGGVNMVQVRAHELSEGELTRLAVDIVDAIGSRALVVVNGLPEIALHAKAAGVHLRESGRVNRAGLPTGTIIGQSVHSVESAVNAESVGADYVILGTVFPSESHPGGATGGVELIASVTGILNIPVIGIGGITAGNAVDVMRAGADGIAVIGAIINSTAPAEAARRLRDAIEIE